MCNWSAENGLAFQVCNFCVFTTPMKDRESKLELLMNVGLDQLDIILKQDMDDVLQTWQYYKVG